MFSPKYKFLSVLGILMVSLTILLCFPWAAIAQFGEQRLIPLASCKPELLLGNNPNTSLRRLWTGDEGYPHKDAGRSLNPEADSLCRRRRV